VVTSCQNGISNHDKFLNQIRFVSSILRLAQKGNITGGTGLFEITCISRSNQFYGIRPSPETGHYCGPKQTAQ